MINVQSAEAPADHTHDTGCLCPQAPLKTRPYHVFVFDSDDPAGSECVHGCGTTWAQMLNGGHDA